MRSPIRPAAGQARVPMIVRLACDGLLRVMAAAAIDPQAARQS
jgi:hypothetical protein